MWCWCAVCGVCRPLFGRRQVCRRTRERRVAVDESAGRTRQRRQLEATSPSNSPRRWEMFAHVLGLSLFCSRIHSDGGCRRPFGRDRRRSPSAPARQLATGARCRPSSAWAVATVSSAPRGSRVALDHAPCARRHHRSTPSAAQQARATSPSRSSRRSRSHAVSNVNLLTVTSQSERTLRDNVDRAGRAVRVTRCAASSTPIRAAPTWTVGGRTPSRDRPPRGGRGETSSAAVEPRGDSPPPAVG